jgi:hypothetical protein
MLVSPRAAEHLDASRATFLDKEFFTDWPRGRRRELDLLARVPMRQDESRCVLVHVEIEARARSGIGARLRSYRNQIQSVHDGQLAALMKRGPWSRAAHKRACLQRIAVAGLDEIREFVLVNCVETYLQLDTGELAELEALRSQDSGKEGRTVKIAVKMTWADRIRAEAWQEGMEQGLETGREQGARRILLRLLGLKFGPLPEAARTRVEAIDSVETLNGLADRVLAARSLGELGLG